MSNPNDQTPQDKAETPAVPATNDTPEHKPDYEYDVYEREPGDSSFERFCDYRGNNRYGG